MPVSHSEGPQVSVFPIKQEESLAATGNDGGGAAFARLSFRQAPAVL